jgi:molecular chaperone HscC
MTIIGIDLGTTNSLGAFWKNGKPHLIANAQGNILTPSVVGVDDDGSILVGSAAKERLLTHPDLTIDVFKRRIGTKEKAQLGSMKFTPEELSALVLRSIKDDAEGLLGESITEAIISVPAYFNDGQRNASKLAGELAGLKVERLINEPTAAAIAYGLHDRDDDSKFMILDLGGGTFDVSILELFDGVMEVHATAGDNFLGGEDFTQVLIDWFLEEHKIEANQLNSTQLNKLIDRCNKTKHALSSLHTSVVKFTYQSDTLELHVDRDSYMQRCQGLLNRIQKPIERAIRDAGLRTVDLQDIILVGGATRLDMVRILISRLFGRFPSNTLNPDEVVCMGTAVQAALKAQDKTLSEVVFTDVAPYSLGTEVAKKHSNGTVSSGYFYPIIERNTIIPASRIERFWTVENNQSEIGIDVFQGESRLIKNNIKLGSLTVKVPKSPAGEEAVDVRFTYDVNGLLELEVSVVDSNVQKRLVIDNSGSQLSEDEIKACFEKLADLKIHPREQIEIRSLLSRAERIYEESLGEIRELLSNEIVKFEHIIERQDPRDTEKSKKAFNNLLNKIEEESIF